MFHKSLEQVFTIEKLSFAMHGIRSRSAGLDKETIATFESDPSLLTVLHEELIEGRYVPQPIKKIELREIQKRPRPIALSSVRDKIVQKTLANELGEYLESMFSDKSYGYRPSKGPLRAIRRSQDFITRGYGWVFKSDIDDFFETIDHQRILTLLKQHITDGRLLYLIELHLKNGGFRRLSYKEHDKGLNQGDALSPLLSNLYLDQMDQYLDRNDIPFVRYADDFVLFGKDERTMQDDSIKLTKFIHSIGLRLGEDKSYIAAVKFSGFEFLGCSFQHKQVQIDDAKLQKKVSKLHGFSDKRLIFEEYISRVNEYTEGIKRYYLRIISKGSEQFGRLEVALLDSVTDRVFKSLDSGELRTKKEIKTKLAGLHMLDTKTKKEHKEFLQSIIDRACGKYLANNKEIRPVVAIEAKKREYSKKFALESVIHVSEYGTSLGIAKNKITIKVKGKLVGTVPKEHCERIIINTKGASVSSNLVHLCSKQGIALDFIDWRYDPYASLYTYSQAYATTAIKQLGLLDTPRQIELARQFIKSKAKNQINYLKYLDKYHDDVESNIIKMEQTLRAYVLKAKDIPQLMGYEGEISALYWHSIAKIIEDKITYPGRVTNGATDLVNSCLNYAYAILYGKVQYHAVKAGLAIHISFLHALSDSKPTLVYDMIEEYRTFIVDRSIITMINQQEPLKLGSDGRLTKTSRQLIARDVTERLGNYTKHKKASKKIETIISEQAYALVRAIKEDNKYRPFIGKY